MNAARVLFHVIRADFLERVRRQGFLITLGATLWAAYIFLPPNGAKYVTLQVAHHRGLYGSAWVGAAIALLASPFLSLFGFYLVKNTIERDRLTGVGQILATTPLPKWLYTLGKALSNFAVLATLTGLLGVGAIGMQLLRAEDMHIDLVAIFAPLAVVTLPALLVVSALAVLFEAVRWLRGGLGNVVYFFVWALLMVATQPHRMTEVSGIGDFVGASMLLPSILHATAAAFPGVDPNTAQLNIGFNFTPAISGRHLELFSWIGPHWTPGLLALRMVWVGLGLLLAFVASIPFDRFDTAAASPRARRASAPALPQAPLQGALTPHEAHSVARLPVASRSPSLWPLLRGELLLMLGGMPRVWGVLALGLAIACWFAPLRVTREILLPIAWLWPALAWSSMGAREQLHHTQSLIFSSPRPLARQLAACWLAGALLAFAMGLGAGARLLAGGDAAAALAWLVGALFIPTLALACGVWSGNGRLFEITFLMLWYVGLINHAPPLDFAATRPEALEAGAPLTFAIATMVLGSLAVLGRMRRLRG